MLNGREPAVAAKELVTGTKLSDLAVRKSLLEGGAPAIAASTDPMIVLARKLDPIVRAQIKKNDAIEGVLERAGEKLGKARFAVYGKSSYPDATFTLRLSYGAASGYPMNGTIAPYKTTYYGLYDRSASFNNAPPFNLPTRYVDRLGKFDLNTPLDFVTTNDIIGGNSGSPVINQERRTRRPGLRRQYSIAGWGFRLRRLPEPDRRSAQLGYADGAAPAL